MALRFTIIDQFGNNNRIDEPVGWDAINLHYVRHKDWHGFIDAVDDTMGSLQFYGDGYKILSSAFATYGVEAQCGFLVEYQCNDQDTIWDTIYSGQFSFYQYKEVQGLNGCHAECSVESASNVMVLKNRYDQKVDLNSLIPFLTPASPQATVLNQIQAISTTLTDPPNPNTGTVTVNTGDTYLVPSSTGTWQSGTANYIAVWTDAGAWSYTPPQNGQILIDMSTHDAYVYNGTAWVAFTGQMSVYDGLGGQVVMPSKTIPLTTTANVNPSPYASPANTVSAASSGGSSFTLNNAYDYGCGIPLGFAQTNYESDPAQSGYSMELSWIGGVVTQDVPSFVGANSKLWIGTGISNTNPDPIFTYIPNTGVTAPQVNVNINIIGTVSALNDPNIANWSGNPVQVSVMKASLCYGTGSFGNAFGGSGNVFGANGIQNLTLTGGTQGSGNTPFETYIGGTPIGFSFSYVGPMVNIPSGTNVYLVFEFDFANRCSWDILNNKQGSPQICTIAFSGKASFEVDSSFPDTAAPVYLINESLSRVTEAISDEQIRVYSDFFGRTDSQPYNTGVNTYATGLGTGADGEGSLLCITNGLLIRGQSLLDGSQPPMPVSLKQLFEALNAIYNIGMTIEADPTRSGMNWLRIEPMSHFYPLSVIRQFNSTNLLVLDNVDEVTTEIQAEKYVGIFRTGYSKWQGEQTGGLDDFMNKREYRTTLSTSKNVLEKYCGFIGSSYAIETTRRQTGINSQDWRFDHENFFICMKRSISTNTPGSGAQGTVVLSTDIIGAILNIIVNNGGSGYSIPPTVEIDPPTSPTIALGGVQATAIAFVTNGAVSAIQITNEGNGYTGTVNVNFGSPSVQAVQVEQQAVDNPTSPITSTTMVDPNSLYNYRISPLRNAMRWVRSIFQSYADWMGGVLYFVSGEANIRATGEYAGGQAPVIENHAMAEDQAIISYNDFADPTEYYPLYTNQLVKFTYPLSYQDWKAITANPYGLIKYSVNSGPYQYGWIDELKYSPFEGTAEFTLKQIVPTSGSYPTIN